MEEEEEEVWDDKLAAVAQKWAKQCVLEHDKNRKIPSYGLHIGQNLAAGHGNWRQAMSNWYDEVADYRYGENVNDYLGPDGFFKIGHYTQFVNNSTIRIGCGFAYCSNTIYGRYYACNYATGQGRISNPYTEGPRCSACPNTCKGGLCDCKGKLCLNTGRINASDCSCICPKIYGGPDCSQLICPPRDPFYCGTHLVFSDCEKFFNVPHLCPYMCRVCENPSLPPPPTSTTRRPVFVSPYNCTYRGERATPDQCRTYGDRGMDKPF
ncbi:cysteine-rich venom protein Mr30-like, partial [Aplysia californica]|uniref:Cysteine-rich venom protein Mr30-like n=1 Tax=Aplysia californica TaxID=6500 RepID=A0ABM1VYS7_APLCA